MQEIKYIKKCTAQAQAPQSSSRWRWNLKSSAPQQEEIQSAKLSPSKGVSQKWKYQNFSQSKLYPYSVFASWPAPRRIFFANIQGSENYWLTHDMESHAYIIPRKKIIFIVMYFHPRFPHCLAPEKPLSHSISTHSITVKLKIIKIKSKYI